MDPKTVVEVCDDFAALGKEISGMEELDGEVKRYAVLRNWAIQCRLSGNIKAALDAEVKAQQIENTWRDSGELREM